MGLLLLAAGFAAISMKGVQIIAKILKTMESMQAEMQKMEKLPYCAEERLSCDVDGWNVPHAEYLEIGWRYSLNLPARVL